jgi:hypothetical protein
MPDERKSERYGVRPDPKGFTVFVRWTGQAAVVGGVPQTGLSEADAQHTAKVLNADARRGDSSMRDR